MTTKHEAKCEVVSESLISKDPVPSVGPEFYKPFCLGLLDWCPCCIKMAEQRKGKSLSLKRPHVTVSDQENSKKTSETVDRQQVKLTSISSNQENGEKSKADNSKKSDKTDERYLFDVTFDDLNKFKEGECPANTEKNTEWAIRNFEFWRLARNKRFPEEQCPPNVLFETDGNELCDWLCKYISETCKVDGTEYTPRTLYLLLAGIQRHIRKVNPSSSINIFQDIEFKPVKHVCDSVFKRLHAKGIGTETKATAVLSVTEEDGLWESGVMGLDTPVGLLNAVFFYNGKKFCLRGGAEHRNLKLSQIKKEITVVDGKMVNSYVYQEFGSKNNQGGFSSLNLQNKVVKQHESSSSKCHVKILDKYLQVLPPDASSNDVFYLKPLKSVPLDSDAPWFSSVPIGKNKLNGLLKEMCAEAGITGNFTNHSLRAYGATTLFQSGVSEKLIQQQTGHRSTDALRQYERTSESQLVEVSNIMSGEQSDEQQHGGKEETSKVSPWSIQTQSIHNQSIQSIQTPPKIVLNGCTFTGCSVTFSGNAFNSHKEDTAELLKGLSYDDIFKD